VGREKQQVGFVDMPHIVLYCFISRPCFFQHIFVPNFCAVFCTQRRITERTVCFHLVGITKLHMPQVFHHITLHCYVPRHFFLHIRSFSAAFYTPLIYGENFSFHPSCTTKLPQPVYRDFQALHCHKKFI
jgi:hypothetical protein